MTEERAIAIIKSECYVMNLLNFDRTQMINTALDMAIKALEQTKWISASEKLPEEYIHVLCQFCMGGMAECYYAHGFFHVVGGLRLSNDEIMAWQPLPQPYTESEDNVCKDCYYNDGDVHAECVICDKAESEGGK